jgi:hypothetical protein
VIRAPIEQPYQRLRAVSRLLNNPISGSGP